MDGRLDVEVCDGAVVAVWFNCLLLPYQQHDVDIVRAREMHEANPSAVINNVDVAYRKDVAA